MSKLPSSCRVPKIRNEGVSSRKLVLVHFVTSSVSRGCSFAPSLLEAELTGAAPPAGRATGVGVMAQVQTRAQATPQTGPAPAPPPPQGRFFRRHLGRRRQAAPRQSQPVQPRIEPSRRNFVSADMPAPPQHLPRLFRFRGTLPLQPGRTALGPVYAMIPRPWIFDAQWSGHNTPRHGPRQPISQLRNPNLLASATWPRFHFAFFPPLWFNRST